MYDFDGNTPFWCDSNINFNYKRWDYGFGLVGVKVMVLIEDRCISDKF